MFRTISRAAVSHRIGLSQRCFSSSVHTARISKLFDRLDAGLRPMLEANTNMTIERSEAFFVLTLSEEEGAFTVAAQPAGTVMMSSPISGGAYQYKENAAGEWESTSLPSHLLIELLVRELIGKTYSYPQF